MDRLISVLKSDKEIIGEEDDLSLQLKARKFARRGIYTDGFVKRGDLLSEKNITTKRPVGNIPASEYKSIIGKKLNKDLKDDTSISYEDIS
jgi:N-acetylneuraminate synthase